MRKPTWSENPGEYEYLDRAIKYGVRDIPSVPFKVDRVLPPIKLSEEDREYFWEGFGRCITAGSLRGADRTVRGAESPEGAHDFIGICGLGRGGRGPERAVTNKILSAEKVLTRRNSEDRDDPVI